MFRAFAYCFVCAIVFGADHDLKQEVQRFTAPNDVRVSGATVLIVTHPGEYWDFDRLTKGAVDAAIRFAKSQQIPRIYLQSAVNDSHYFPEDKNPTYIVKSTEGTFAFDVKPTIVISLGGNFSECHMLTINRLLSKWHDSKNDLKIILIVPAIYTHTSARHLSKFSNEDLGDHSLSEKEWNRVRDGLKETLKKSGLNQYSVPLSEVFGYFPNDMSVANYLKHFVKTWYQTDRFLPFHRIAVRYQGIERMVKDAPEKDAPALRFEFINPKNSKDIPDALERVLRTN
jgi:hypothetical protein